MPGVRLGPHAHDGEGTCAGPARRGRCASPSTACRQHTQAIGSMDDLAADPFESDEELAEFLAFTYSERHRDMV